MSVQKICFVPLIQILSTVSKSFLVKFSAPIAAQQASAQPPDICRTEADRLFFQGAEQYQLCQLTTALKSGQQALAIYREIGARTSEGFSLSLIGTVFTGLNQYSQALLYHNQALVIFRELGNRQLEGIALDNIGAVYVRQGQYHQALEFRQKALVIFRELGDRVNEAVTLDNIESVHKLLNRVHG